MSFSQKILDKVKVQNLQSCESRDGYAYSGTFCIGNTKIATVQNSGCGGNTDYRFLSDEAKQMFNKFVADNNLKQLMADDYNSSDDRFIPRDWSTDDFDADSILSQFMEEFMQIKADNKIINRLQKKGICFGVSWFRNF